METRANIVDKPAERHEHLARSLIEIGEAKLPDGTPVRWRPHLIDAIDELLLELRKGALMTDTATEARAARVKTLELYP